MEQLSHLQAKEEWIRICIKKLKLKIILNLKCSSPIFTSCAILFCMIHNISFETSFDKGLYRQLWFYSIHTGSYCFPNLLFQTNSSKSIHKDVQYYSLHQYQLSEKLYNILLESCEYSVLIKVSTADPCRNCVNIWFWFPVSLNNQSENRFESEISMLYKVDANLPTPLYGY